MTQIELHLAVYEVIHVIVWLLYCGPREAKIANLDVALRVNENVAWLDIPMYDTSRVNEIDSAQKIVQKIFDMILVKLNSFGLF